MPDGTIRTELIPVIGQYQRQVLKGKPLPDDFPLRRFPGLLPQATGH
jgi:hypothetical protein